MDFVDVFAYTATFLNIIMMVPQVAQTWKTKKTKEFALSTPIMFLVACVLWVFYGVAKNAIPVIVANTIVGGMNSVLIYCKVKYNGKYG